MKLGVAAELATEVSGAFEEARYSVGAEESLERKYRLEPSPEVRAKHKKAAAMLVTALQRARYFGAGGVLIDEILAKHDVLSGRHRSYVQSRRCR